MKQTALILILAQIGCYVPADSAEIGIIDSILTRMGSSDDLSSGQSTFMVEMIETAYLLNNTTERSLLLLDEVGRGTSTYDGVAIAWATAEHIAKSGARAIFATHYHELNSLTEEIKEIKNFQVSVEHTNNQLIFTHKVIEGGADESYGIEVAEMAGIPSSVTKKANNIMKKISSSGLKKQRTQVIKDYINQIKLEI